MTGRSNVPEQPDATNERLAAVTSDPTFDEGTWRPFDARSEVGFEDRNSSKNSQGNEHTTS